MKKISLVSLVLIIFQTLQTKVIAQVICPTPKIFSITNISPSSAFMYFSCGDFESITYPYFIKPVKQFKVEYKPDSSNIWNSVIVNFDKGNGGEFYLTGLHQLTQYNLRIVSICDSTVTGNPTEIQIFKTLGKKMRAFPTGLPTCLEDDFKELEKLYDATNGNTWRNSTNWFTNPDLNTWYGVHLSNDGCHVDSLKLGSNELWGELPNLKLPNLVFLNLSGNFMSGSLPNFVMPKMQKFYLDFNRFSGELPNFNFPNVTDFFVNNTSSIYSNNERYSGTIPNFNYPKIKYLNLYDENFSGQVPSFDSLKSLQYLILDKNHFTGFIPNFNLPELTNLSLSENDIRGSIPNFNLPKLKYLSLYSNNLTENIPNFDLPSLMFLSLNNNQLSGSIPNFNLPKLQTLSLSNNSLSGKIPDIKFSTKYTDFFIENNQFIFEDVIDNTWYLQPNFYLEFTEQKSLPLSYDNGTFTFDDGSSDNSQTFEWFRVDTKEPYVKYGKSQAVTNTKNFKPYIQGYYYCVATHTKLSERYKNSHPFYLQSDTLYFLPNNNLKVFPNPTQDVVSVLNNEPTDYIIYDYLGRQMMRGVLAQNQTDISLKVLEHGFYFLKTKFATAKIFKE